MAGPLTIQRVPKGLLDYLSLKGSGNAPTELAEKVSGIVNLTEIYLQDRVQTGNFGTGAIAAVGDVNATGGTVPFGEIWFAYHLAISGTVAAANTYRLCPAIFRRTGLTISTYGPRQAYLATERVSLGWDLPPAILLPGDSVGIGVEQVTAGSTAFSVYLYYARITI